MKDILQRGLTRLDSQIEEKKAWDRRFQSALQNEALTSLVLQFALYDQDAVKILTADHGLGHLYHRKQFTSAGVNVIGAGSAHLNGFYRRRDVSEGPPEVE